MLVHKTNKSFMSRSDKPNANWLKDDNYFIVPDNSELYNKIIESDGNFDYVLDDEGNLIDIKYDKTKTVPDLEKENEKLKVQIENLSEQQEFIESCLMEMAQDIYD